MLTNIQKIDVRDRNNDGSIDRTEFDAALNEAGVKAGSSYQITQNAYLAANSPSTGTIEKGLSDYLTTTGEFADADSIESDQVWNKQEIDNILADGAIKIKNKGGFITVDLVTP
jgi:hypothetical protein